MDSGHRGNAQVIAWHERRWPRAFLTAVQFLSRIPVPGGAKRDPSTFADDIRRGAVFFPLIGCLLGTVTAIVLVCAAQLVAWPVAVLIALAADAYVTGAFHEDAVADFCDAFGGGWTREDTLRILKGSRIGSFGALGLGLAVALRATAMIAIPDIWHAAVVVIAAGGIGRLVALVAMAVVPPVAGRDSLSKDMGQEASLRTVLTAALLISPLFLWLFWRAPMVTIMIALVLGVFVVWFQKLLVRRLGGITGDCLGFAAYAGILATTIGLSR
jgi:adenosylcobinamide-GDP ribazoletransferase